MSIECFNLTKRFGQKTALNNVSVEIPEGGITGLIGPNGAGKSTLIKLITGLVYPTQGCVRIDGYDSCSEHIAAMDRLGAIVEWPSFYPDLTARQNLAIFSGGHGRKYEEKLEEIASFLEIKDILGRKTNTFSTGMKQRLGIALAMLPDSKYIILDEPANGLDPAGIVEIRNLICECRRRIGVTVLVSSHLLSEVELICDHVIMLVKGELRAAGSLKELLGAGRKYRVVTSDMEKCFAFLTREWQKGTSGLAAEPLRSREGILLALNEDACPEKVSSELFRQGFAIGHFARETERLEEFFMARSQNTKDEKGC